MTDEHLRHVAEHIAALIKDGFPREAENAIEANERRVRAEATQAMWENVATAVDNIAPSNWSRGSVISAIEAVKPKGCL